MRMGELSMELEKGHKVGQGNKVQLPVDGKLKSQALKAAGISKNAAYRYEALARSAEAGAGGFKLKEKNWTSS